MNKVMLIGNLGKDPDVRYLDSGVAVATFSIATTERGYTTSNGTQVPDRTDWNDLVLWRGLAEVAEKYLRKGSKVFVEGKLHKRSYDDQQGIRRTVTEIYVDNMEMLSSNPNTGKGLPPEIPGEAKPSDAPASNSGLPFPPAGGDMYDAFP